MGQFLGFMGRWLYIGLAVIAICDGSPAHGDYLDPLALSEDKG